MTTLEEKRIHYHKEGFSYDRRAFKNFKIENGDTIFRGVDVKEAIKKLKERISKHMLLDGYMGNYKGEKESFNTIMDEIFGFGLVNDGGSS